MNSKHFDQRNIIGISVRTTNQNGQSATDIPLLWKRFFEEQLIQQIPNKIGDALYCIYTDYELDHTKPYTTILGCEVSSLTEIPEGFTGKIIEEGDYLPFTAKGKLSDNIVFEEWQKIWNTDIPRSYLTDFEIYGKKAQNPDDAEVEIYISTLSEISEPLEKPTPFLLQKHLYLGIARYLLGIGMFPYAITKILRTQLVLSGYAWAQATPLESISSMTLTWAFLGHSWWFQVLLGFCELIPALLLLFRRTSLLGAILMFPVSLNVLLINYALNLWPGTKIIAAILFTLNVIILLIEWKTLKSIVLAILSKGLKIKLIRIEIAINTVVIIVFGYLASKPLLEYRAQTNELTGDWLNQHPIEWVLEKEEIGDSVFYSREAKVYFGAYDMYNEDNAKEGTYPEKYDTYRRTPKSYKVDLVKHTLDFKYDGDSTLKFNYSLIDSNSRLRIEGPINSATNAKRIEYYRKRVINKNR
ncbi:MAG: hypothetical protein EOO92_08965 [Pedobacter sp.]|nr:MAG: hypothetical protein EOO92_08965 [Pedobacter sp.]